MRTALVYALFCVVFLSTTVCSVNPANDAGLNTVPTPWYAGQARVSSFNAGIGPRSVYLYFDNATALYYDVANVNVTSADGIADGIQIVSMAFTPVIIYVQATVQYGPTWSADESSPVLLDFHAGTTSFQVVPLLNTGANSTYSIYEYVSTSEWYGNSFRVLVQYASADAPQFTNFFVSITPYSG